jgi:hypothetical protein
MHWGKVFVVQITAFLSSVGVLAYWLFDRGVGTLPEPGRCSGE